MMSVFGQLEQQWIILLSRCLNNEHWHWKQIEHKINPFWTQWTLAIFWEKIQVFQILCSNILLKRISQNWLIKHWEIFFFWICRQVEFLDEQASDVENFSKMEKGKRVSEGDKFRFKLRQSEQLSGFGIHCPQIRLEFLWQRYINYIFP